MNLEYNKLQLTVQQLKGASRKKYYAPQASSPNMSSDGMR